jgi:hypothetical protein
VRKWTHSERKLCKSSVFANFRWHWPSSELLPG